MHIAPPARHRATTGTGRRSRRAARLSAMVAGLALPALIGGAALAGNASADTTTHITPGNTFYLQLDVSGASTAPGAPVIDWYSDGGANQVWTFSSVGGANTYEIINQNSNQCLTTDGVAGDQLYQLPCSGSQEQQWKTNLPAEGAFKDYSIQNVYSGLYVDVSGDSPWPGSAIDAWYGNGQPNQMFSAD
jgi:Ricin-type beta-trefoil lectin domain-like